MKFDNQLRYAVKIVETFRGEMPLHTWLKNFFRENKQMGSSDRKQVSGMVYGFYRLGRAAESGSTSDKIITGIFLCSNSHSELLEYFKPAWNNKIASPFQEKYAMLGAEYLALNVFPWKNELSGEVDHAKFCESFFIQPDLFIRLRPGMEEIVKQKLRHAGIEFRQIGNSCIALHNATRIDHIIEINKEAVVQDYSSQQTGQFFEPLPMDDGAKQSTAWDCCAGSGGKSIMLYDIHPGIELTVSDIRESILTNLKKRFSEAGIKKYTAFISDLSTVNHQPSTPRYDLIIADVPCTGSGTWGRNPEALYFFDEKEIGRYSNLQKKIVSNIIPALKKNGRLVYITCSVFKKENEEMVDFIRQEFHLRVEKTELLKGYEDKADSMFAASFIA